VLAVGDGINDAPLLATAAVGLAVGEGAGALAVQAADGVLLRDPLGSLVPLLALARRARRVARANLAFAAAVIAGLVAWDLTGTLPLAVGVAGHELSTVLVCLNGLRLLALPAAPARPRRGHSTRPRRPDAVLAQVPPCATTAQPVRGRRQPVLRRPAAMPLIVSSSARCRSGSGFCARLRWASSSTCRWCSGSR
jgi:hypothetical protein